MEAAFRSGEVDGRESFVGVRGGEPANDDGDALAYAAGDVEAMRPLSDGRSVAWLRDNEAHPGWGHTWVALWEREVGLSNSPEKVELVALGTRRLDDPQCPGWSFVWVELIEYAALHSLRTLGQALAEIGALRLLDDEHSRSWAFIWQGLDEHPELMPASLDRGTLAALAARWLRGHVEHPGWAKVWEVVFCRALHYGWGDLVEKVAALGHGLLHHGLLDRFPSIWSKLRAEGDRALTAPQRDEVLRVALAWLSDPKGVRRGEAFVIEGLLDGGCRSPEFLLYAWTQVERMRPGDRWAKLAARMIAVDPLSPRARPALKRLSGLWLSERARWTVRDVLRPLLVHGDIPDDMREALRKRTHITDAEEALWRSLGAACERAEPVHGRVVERRPDGYRIDVGTTAFFTMAFLTTDREDLATDDEVSCTVLRVDPRWARVVLADVTARASAASAA